MTHAPELDPSTIDRARRFYFDLMKDDATVSVDSALSHHFPHLAEADATVRLSAARALGARFFDIIGAPTPRTSRQYDSLVAGFLCDEACRQQLLDEAA
jgi:hypothetical protein